MTQEEYIKQLENFNIIPLETYKNNRTKIKHKCLKCNNEFINSPYNIIHNNKGCIICNRNKKYLDKISEYNLTILENYINSDISIKHKCLKCNNEFIQKPKYLLSNKEKCPKCFKEGLRNTENKTKLFQDRIKNLDSDYVLLSEYINSNTKVKIRHTKCNNEYYVTPNNFLKGRRCPKCSKRLRKTTNIIKNEIKELYENEYTLLSEYINDKIKIRLLHNKCNKEFYVRASSFLANEHTKCPYCSNNYKKTNEEFKKEVFNLVGNEYTLLSEYKGTNKKILIRHNKCNNEYYVTPNKFINYEQRCPHCKRSKGELKIKEYLDKNNISYQEEYSFEDCKNVNKLRFDFRINLNNNEFILLEFDGIQHFKESFYNEDFNKNKERDKIKDKYCKDNNIKLIRIPYWKFDEIENILNNIMQT